MPIQFRRRRITHHIGGGGIVLLLLIASLMFFSHGGSQNRVTSSVGAAVMAGVPVEKNTSMEVIFCPVDDCESALLSLIQESKESVHCAFYDLNLKSIILELANKSSRGLSVRVVVDNDNYDLLKSIGFVRSDNSSPLMHNKFCIFDGKTVMTGSFNPTFNCAFKNNNNMITIKSSLLSKNYESEFEELWKGTFGKGSRTEDTAFYLDNTYVENYFCPEDWCANKVLEELYAAKESIYFMLFSFTHGSIGDILVNKNWQGVDVKGVMEKSQNSKYSEYDKLINAGIDVVWDEKNTRGVMHHKVFIIDNSTVVTGSFNPTSNADTKNDENILIIKDEAITRRYLDEFERIVG